MQLLPATGDAEAMTDTQRDASLSAILELQGKFIYTSQLEEEVKDTAARQLAERLKELEGIAQTPASAERLAALTASMFLDTGEGDPRQLARENALRILDAHKPADDDQLSKEDYFLIRKAILADGPLPEDEAAQLEARFGWFGQILNWRFLPSSDPGKQHFAEFAHLLILIAGAGILLVVSALIAGFVLLIIAIVLRSAGRLKTRLTPPGEFRDIYLEAFAFYLTVSIIGLQLGTYLLSSVGVHLESLATMGIIVVSFISIAWPFIRGVPGKTVCRDVGLNPGRSIIREVFSGIIGYITGLPILLLGIGITALLSFLVTLIKTKMGIQEEETVITHPIIGMLAEGGIGIKLMLLIFGAVFAPVVEETIFRGNLFAHLRSRLPFLPAALIVAFIFAAIHPQGLLAIPVLMSLAFVFAMIREWRDSLIGPMVAHALNNGTILSLIVIVFSI